MPSSTPEQTPEERSASQREIEARAAWAGVSAAFAALGRAFICADRAFRVVHASYALDQILGEGAADRAAGEPLEDLLGPELFGEIGAVRQALLAGERREGWRAHLRMGDSDHHLVSISAAPFEGPPGVACDPRVAFVVVVRPAGDDQEGHGPTAISGLIARSPAMLRIFALIENLAHSEATILVSGESGTGKELVARAIHDHSPRRRGPFVAVNCGALPGELLESEMFGHVRGAFTGAVRDREGRFEFASEGTLFLDEVGDLPLTLQVKLLRALQDGTFQRLGENRTRVSHARLIAATHVDLMKAVHNGAFRDDLYYRLRVVPVEIPPLRHRREDIEPLARALLARVSARHGRSMQFSPDALRVLLRHDWPGNVRELENALEYAVAVGQGQTILPEDLPVQPSGSVGETAASAQMSQASTVPPPESHDSGRGRDRRAAAERQELRRVLDQHHWRRADAARALGMSRTTLWRKMRDLGLE